MKKFRERLALYIAPWLMSPPKQQPLGKWHPTSTWPTNSTTTSYYTVTYR